MRINFIGLIQFLVLLLLLNSCDTSSGGKLQEARVEELMHIIATPDAPGFGLATKELAEMGSEAAPASELLATALSYNRRDSYMAGIALISIGPDAHLACSQLRKALNDERTTVRCFAAEALGAIGERAIAAVPDLAARLWDEDAWVRTAAAGAIEAITGEDLLADSYELNPSIPGSVSADDPEGRLSGAARTWWLESGEGMNWMSNGRCEGE